MALLKIFKSAVKKMARPAEPARMMTRGFEGDTLSGASFYRFAEAQRTGSGVYNIAFFENAGAVLAHDQRGHTNLTLRQALDFLYEWERKCQRTDRTYELTGDGVPYFGDVAAEFGIKLGPDSASLRQAGRAKLVVAQRRGRRR